MKHRERLERLEEGKLAAELRRQAERQQALDASQRRRQAVLDVRPPAAGRLDLLQLASTSAAVVRFGREIEARATALAHSAEAVAQQRRVLMERRRDRKAMETLLERRLEEERIAQNRQERKQIDEIAGVRWHLQRRTTEGAAPWH